MKLYSAYYKCWNPFDEFYPEAECVVATPGAIKAPGLLILHGGSDIHPSLYHRANEYSRTGHVPSTRDTFEMRLFAEAVKEGVPIMAICRGAQLACAMVGGILVQDVDGHGWGGHRIQTDTGEEIYSNSIHHQMMYPWKTEHKLLGWSAIPKATLYKGITEDEYNAWPKKLYEGSDIEGVVEPEIVWFPQVKCLAVQGHPEMMDSHTALNQHVKELLSVYCLPS